MADQITHISSTYQPDEGEGDDVQVSENEEHLNSLQTTHFLEENSSEEDSSEEDSSEEDSSEEEGEEQRVSAADEQEDVKEAKDNVEQVSEAEDEANESSEEEDSSEEEEENEEQVAEAPDQPNTMPDEDDLNKNKEEKDEKIPEAKDQADVLPDEEEKEDKHVPEVEDYTDALPEGGSHEAADERQIPEDEVSADVLSKEDEEQAIGTEEQADAAPEKDPSQEVKGTAEQVLEVEEQADALHEGESLSQEVIPPEDTENGPSDEESKGNVNEDASIQMEHMSSDEDEMSNDQIINSDATLEPHQALEMASLEETVATAESPRNKAISSSRFTSFQGKNRDERLKFMVEQAEGRAKKVRLGEGVKSVFQANMDDIGALGIGMQLYFMLTKYLSVTFLCMGIISLPAVMVNSYGQGITSKMVDPLQLAYSSIGNGGVNSDTAASARSCLPIGDIDCTWQTVNTPLTSNPKVVTWIVALTDVLYSFFFMCFLLFYSYRAKKAIKEHQNKHLTPA
ncbi:Transmembrane protein, partial [Phytophthora palmivora]